MFLHFVVLNPYGPNRGSLRFLDRHHDENPIHRPSAAGHSLKLIDRYQKAV